MPRFRKVSRGFFISNFGGDLSTNYPQSAATAAYNTFDGTNCRIMYAQVGADADANTAGCYYSCHFTYNSLLTT